MTDTLNEAKRLLDGIKTGSTAYVPVRLVRDLVAEVERLRADDWQPIETAPDDGTPVLLWANVEGWEHNGFSRVTGYYDGYCWSIYDPSGAEPKARKGSIRNRYQDIQRLGKCNPTHWKPLPNPPEVK